MAALANPERGIRRILATAEVAARIPPDSPALRAGIRVEIAEPRSIAALLPAGAAHQGLAIQCDPLPELSLDALVDRLDSTGRGPEGLPTCLLALDQVTDPGNVGALLRSAAAFGAAAILIPEHHGSETTPALAKAASGALERVPLLRVGNLSRSLQQLKREGFWIVGLDAHGGVPITEASLGERIVLVLGSEGRGLRRLVGETCDLRIHLAIGEAVESLNVSAAGAIALHEWRRRHPLPDTT